MNLLPTCRTCDVVDLCNKAANECFNKNPLELITITAVFYLVF